MTPGSTRPRGRPRSLSAAEALLWAHLRDRGLEGWLFWLRRSHSTASPAAAATFYCPDARITVQVDTEPGPLTFTSLEVLVTTESVLQAILLALRTALTHRRSN